MTTEREHPTMNDIKPVWPDFIAPPKYDNPDPRWVDPALPDFRLIWKVARECGYAVGLHGSMKRDCDLIAVPWTDEAVLAFDLIYRLCEALNAQVLGPVAGKPHGRLGWNLQVDGYVKVIDISVVPRSQDRATPDLKRIGTGLYETQPAPDYSLAPHLQRIVEAAKNSPKWDTEKDRLAATDPAAIREAWEKAYWRMRSYAVHDDACKLNKPPRFDGPCSCGLTAALEEALALIQK